MRFLSSLLVVAILSACATTTDDTSDPVDDTSSAYTGPIPDMIGTTAPADAVASWNQPDSEGYFDQYGYCGATAAANLLRWYGSETSPRDAIDNGCWSYIGTRAPTLAAYLKKAHPELGCQYKTLGFYDDAFATLRHALESGHPVVLEFMTGKLNAHWVTAIGIQSADHDPKIVVMSWGGYYTLEWSKLQDAWRRAWGGYYPYIACDATIANASALHVTAE